MILPGGTFFRLCRRAGSENARTRSTPTDAVRRCLRRRDPQGSPVDEQLGTDAVKIAELGDFKAGRRPIGRSSMAAASNRGHGRSAASCRAGLPAADSSLKIAEFSDLERHQSKLLVDRNFLAIAADANIWRTASSV